jgi:hypothetical protein
VERKAKI